MTENPKTAVHIGLVLCGAVLGSAIAYLVAHELLLRAGRVELGRYSERLIHDAEQFGEEADVAIATVTQDDLEYCSDQELALMRRSVYNSRHIKDLGREKDGRLYCTAGLGRISVPPKLPVPDITVEGRNIYANTPLAISEKSTGFILEAHDVSVVINPETFRNLYEPPMAFTAFAFDAEDRLLLRDFGDAVPLANEEVLSGQYFERKDSFFQPICSGTRPVCIVADERRADMLSKGKALVAAALLGGALMGAGLTLILILLYQRQVSVERQLLRAIRRGALTLVYQPIVDLETKTIVGAEALSRWVNDAGESVRPDIFIALAEEKGFANQITKLVLKKSLEQLGDLLARGSFRITINITAQDLTDPEFFTHLEQCMIAAKVKPSAIGLELTERSTADRELAIQSITRLQRAGHTVYIDDFGTGYSSLAYLHQLAADAIKIDQIFTQTVGTEAVTASVVPQLLDIAKRLDLLVVVEGIETVEQAQYFRAAGPGILGQGWFFSKAVPAAQFRKLVASGSFVIPDGPSDVAQPLDRRDD